MKDAMGGVPVFQLVIVFILLFTGIMCLTINHSKAFGVKDEVINVIESSDIGTNNNVGLSHDIISKIIGKLNDFGYRTDGSCPDSDWQGYDRNGNETQRNDAVICIRANSVNSEYETDGSLKCSGKCDFVGGFSNMVYYDIALFYQLDIPLVSTFNFRVYGSTKVLFK